MKNKMTMILMELLLYLSLIPSQAIAAFNPIDNTPPIILEQEDPQNDRSSNEPSSPEHPVSQFSASAQSEDPGLSEDDHKKGNSRPNRFFASFSRRSLSLSFPITL